MPRVVAFLPGMRFACLAAVGLLACSSDPPAEQCVPVAVDLACTPAYDPTFDQVWTKTFQPSCAKGGSICHASTGKQGGIDFSNVDVAFKNLEERGVVKAGDPACSKIVGRISATDGARRMPPGANLPAGEQCAIERWIANGAKR